MFKKLMMVIFLVMALNGSPLAEPIELYSGTYGDSYTLAVDKNYVVWADSFNEQIYRINKGNGGNFTILADLTIGPSLVISIHNDYVYYAQYNENTGEGSIKRVPIGGGSVEDIFYSPSGYEGGIRGMCLKENSIFWIRSGGSSVNNGAVIKIADINSAINGSGSAIELVNGVSNPTGLVSKGDNLFYIESPYDNNNQNYYRSWVKKISINGGTPQTLAVTDEHLFSVNADATHVYCGSSNGIYSVPRSGGNFISLGGLGGDNDSIKLAVDNLSNTVVYVSRYYQRILKVSKNGCLSNRTSVPIVVNVNNSRTVEFDQEGNMFWVSNGSVYFLERGTSGSDGSGEAVFLMALGSFRLSTCLEEMRQTYPTMKATLDISVNGSFGSYPNNFVSLNRGELVRANIRVDPSDVSGYEADWYAYVNLNDYTYWYTLNGWVMSNEPIPAYQGPLTHVENYLLFELYLPVGDYFVNFAVSERNNPNISNVAKFGVSIL